MINSLLNHCNQPLNNKRREELLTIIGKEMYSKKSPKNEIPIEKVDDSLKNLLRQNIKN